jgi:hypothetical protein
MTTADRQTEHSAAPTGAIGDSALWFGTLAGPIAWAARFTASYAFVEPACATGAWWLLPMLTAAGVLVTAVAGLIAWRAWRSFPAADGGAVFGRRRFMAFAGVSLSVLFIVVTLAESLPMLWIGPCA